MGLLGKVLRRGEKAAGPTYQQQLLLLATQGEAMKGDSEQDREWKNLLAFKGEVIHDEDREAILSHKTLIPQLVPKMMKDGSGLEFERDKKGEVVRDGNGNPIPKYVAAFAVDNIMASIVNIQSHVNRLSFLQPQSKRLVQLCMEDIIETAKLMMPEKDFDLGTGAYLDSWGVNTVFLVDDAINGNKVKSMLEITKRTRMEVGELPKEKKGIF